MLNKNLIEPEEDKILEHLKKSEKRFKIAMALIFLVICFAAVMIILSIVSSL